MIAVLSVALTLPVISAAGDAEDELIAKVVSAYGGEAIANLSNYMIDEQYLTITVGQGHSPELNEVGRSRQVLHRDIENNKTAYDSWSEGRGGNSQYSTLVDGEKAHAVNFRAGTYGDANSADPYTIAGGSMRTTDAILVHELTKVKDKASLSDEQMFMNRRHLTIDMPFPSSPDLKLFIDAQTYMVSKMVRINPQLGNLDYVFSDYKKHNGISYASSTVFSVAGEPNLISVERDLRFNTDMPDALFELDQDLKPESERVDASQMLVNKISDRVYHIGQNGGFSLFADTNIGTVAAGGYPSLPERFERFQKESDRFKPLRYQVITHHHSDHLGAMAEAVGLGARLVTVSENIDAIKDSASPSPNDQDFLPIKARATFGDGKDRVEVYEVSTIHAASFLVTYVPAEKIVFIADHFGSPFAKGTPVAGQSTVDMLAALDALDIDVKKIATAHNPRIFSIKDMRDSVAAYRPTICSGGRPVCR